jgi:hypothetical protein
MNTGEFEVAFVTFPESADVRALLASLPDTQRMLFLTGIPQRFLNSVLYTAAKEPSIVPIPPRGQLVRFGAASQFSDGLFIDPNTGEVVECDYGTLRWFVNSSLEQFARTVIEVMGRFPFMSNDADDQAFKDMPKELGTIISKIDPSAMSVDRFWSTFVDDVKIGDYTTEMVLDWQN